MDGTTQPVTRLAVLITSNTQRYLDNRCKDCKKPALSLVSDS